MSYAMSTKSAEDGHDGREVDRPERRQDPPEEPQVRLADVTEEVGDPPAPRT